MSNRNSKTQKFLNNSAKYKDFFKSRNLKNITHYSTFNFGNLKRLKDSNVPYVLHEVQPFEKLFMISQKYYNSPEYGWLICYLNELPNEMLVTTGSVLKIYFPIETVLEFLDEFRS